jgi:hypothetical protein
VFTDQDAANELQQKGKGNHDMLKLRLAIGIISVSGLAIMAALSGPQNAMAATSHAVAAHADPVKASATPAAASVDDFVEVQGANGSIEEFVCTPATHALNVGGVVIVLNGCDTRVWLHQYSNGSGWSYCISPNSVAEPTGEYSDAEQALVSSNTADC